MYAGRATAGVGGASAAGGTVGGGGGGVTPAFVFLQLYHNMSTYPITPPVPGESFIEFELNISFGFKIDLVFVRCL